MQAKDKSKLVCNLLRCLFTRREMAMSSLSGKDHAKGKRVLDPKKVETIIGIVQKKYTDCERSFVRTRITQKLKDERRAFFAGSTSDENSDV
ncbi:hypothetical protein HOLleu_45021 [Holothuria leucospilota]|nr:hypothetical protein HOLleu_45021 [Holothuria leucospilota]